MLILLHGPIPCFGELVPLLLALSPLRPPHFNGNVTLVAQFSCILAYNTMVFVCV